MKVIKKTLSGHWGAVVLLSIGSSLIAAASVVQSLAVRNFIDSAVAGSKQGFFRWLLIFFLLLVFFNKLFCKIKICIKGVTTCHFIKKFVNKIR